MTSQIAPARSAAFDVLLAMKRNPELHSDALLHGKRLQPLSPRDKNLTTTLVMGVLRWQMVLDSRIHALLTRTSRLDDSVQVALALGALQLLALDRIPAHAAIFESVELARDSGNAHAAGMVNAVLRKLAQSAKLTPSDAIGAHPEWMVARWRKAFGAATASRICVYNQEPPPATLRLTADDADDGQPSEVGSFVVRARRAVSGDIAAAPAWRQQDEGSQLIAEVAGRGDSILDCCAAPGGKTAILAERNPAAEIVAGDISPRRLQAMQAMFKLPNVRYEVMDATSLPYEQQFDLVLCDAPCSGTGTLARNPEIRHRLTLEMLVPQHDRQVRLLRSAMRALRVGGRLIYSTCSLEAEENEAVVGEALDGQKDFGLLPWRPQVQALEQDGVLRPGTTHALFPDETQDNFLRTLPGAYAGDGFFAACLTRR